MIMKRDVVKKHRKIPRLIYIRLPGRIRDRYPAYKNTIPALKNNSPCTEFRDNILNYDFF